MSIDFPSNPLIGDIYTLGSKAWRYNGQGWESINAGTVVYNIGDLLDIDITTTPPQDGDTLLFNSINETWTPGPIAENSGPMVSGAFGEIQFSDGSSPTADLSSSPDLKWDDVNKELVVTGDINLDDGSEFSTSIQLVSPTANRVISFPDSSGVVGLVEGVGGQIPYNSLDKFGTGNLYYFPSAGTFGYGTGGGSQTQQTSKSTGVVLDAPCGRITLNGAALAADTTVSFTLTNSSIASEDIIVLNHVSGGTFGSYVLNARAAAGSATIAVRNISAVSLTEVIVIGFIVIKSTSVA